MTKLIAVLASSTVLFALGCGGGGVQSPPPPPPPPPVTVSVDPATVTLSAGGSEAFTATVAGTNNSGVTWSVQEGAAGGSVTSAGVYTAPQAGGTYYVIATSQADSSKSARATVTVPLPAIGFKTTGSMAIARAGHTATLLPNGDVLVVGGCNAPNTDTCIPVSPSEVYDPASGTFTLTGSLGTARQGHTATLLPDGRVLIAGGWSTAPLPESTAELYDPSTRSFSPTGSMGTARQGHTATLLPDGKVLIAGGERADFSVLANVLATAELYNPATGSFSPTGSMGTARLYQTATLLSNGKVLIAGGESDSTTLAATELYDPGTSEFTPNASMATGRFGHTATLLANGQVLLAGGYSSSAGHLATAELYDPNAGLFRSTGSMADARCCHSATLLLDGRVMIAGGYPQGGIGADKAELFDPASAIFTPGGRMSTARAAHTATLLPDGQVLVSGGSPDDAYALATAELY